MSKTEYLIYNVIPSYIPTIYILTQRIFWGHKIVSISTKASLSHL